MPNQRNKTKAMIGGYVPQKLADDFKEIAKSLGITSKDLLEQIIQERVNKEKMNESK